MDMAADVSMTTMLMGQVCPGLFRGSDETCSTPPEETAAVHRLLQHTMIEHDAVDPGASVVRTIALALGVSADQLLGITQEQRGKASEQEQEV